MSTGTTYELRLAGHLDQHWSAWFGDLVLTHESDGTTILRGDVADQSELHGLLARVRDLGATLISVTSSDSDHQEWKDVPHRGAPPVTGGARGADRPGRRSHQG